MSSSVYDKAAEALGWRMSQAHGGLINEGHRRGPEWKDYFVAHDAEDACFQDGVENDAQAAALLKDRSRSLAA